MTTLYDYRGAYTDLRDLIRLRYAARELGEQVDKQTSNPLSGLLTSKFRGRGIDFAEVRVYQPGDDVRTIDWRVTARTQVAHTKLFQEEKERPVLILVDQSASMYFGSRVTFKSVLAARIAALLAWAALERGDRVGGIVFSESGHREVRPRRNKHAVLRFLNEIHDFNHALQRTADKSAKSEDALNKSALHKKDGHKKDGVEKNQEGYLTEALANLRRVARHGSVIYLISDLAGFTPESRVHLQPLAMHNQLVGIHVSDPLEASLPSPDLYSITNGKQHLRINTASRSNRDAWEQSCKARLADIQEEFLRVKSPLLFLQTGDSLVSTLNAAGNLASRAGTA